MTIETKLVLGDFTFEAFEIPAEIGFGGAQRLTVHRLVGGEGVIDAMGPTDHPVDWSGYFTGESAVARARYLDTLRQQGKPLALSWGDFRYLVLIREFSGVFHNAFRVPYRISCEVVSNKMAPVLEIAQRSVDQAVRSDSQEAAALAKDVADAPLAARVNALDTAIKSVTSFASATTATINSVLRPLADARARVQVLAASTANVVATITTLGGVLPNNKVSIAAERLLAQGNAMNRAHSLHQLDSVLSRMGGNLGAVYSGDEITVVGGDLHKVALAKLGDSTEWSTVAAANSLYDPTLTGEQTVTVPRGRAKTMGVLTR